MQNTFASKAIRFFLNLSVTYALHDKVQIMNPYKDQNVKKAVTGFYKEYYSDKRKRVFIIGINPGRYGGGITGIAFTDPVALKEKCKIKIDLGNRRELSSKFIYEMIDSYGGVRKFFSEFFLTAIFPLAILKNGKNHNYYDDKKLTKDLYPYLKAAMKEQVYFGASHKCICLGKKNYTFLKMINEELNFFSDIVILDHPRYIMQYKLKHKEMYVEKYLNVLRSINDES
jgi:hypothetical protein